MSRDLLSYCITDRASFKLVARAMMQRDGKWPEKIVVSRDVYRRIYKEKMRTPPDFTGFSIDCESANWVRCCAEGAIGK